MANREPQLSRSDSDQSRLAVLIDADNAQPSVIDALLAEVAKFGVASVKRIYGDWTSTSHTQWKKSLLKHSIQPVQQFAYTSGKNATDSALIIDAMDLMYTRRFDGFCLVSSDSDFTRLAQRLREEGLMVFGFGEKKTPEPFVVACDKFVYTEVLRPAIKKPVVKAGAPSVADKPAATAKSESDARPEGEPKSSAPEVSALPGDLILQAIDEAEDESGWAALANVGTYLTKLRPDFDPRLYGHKKLSGLFKKHPRLFEIEERTPPGSTSKSFFVRARGQG
jgi:uncharacterized LabA/DUF88 family protein